MKKIVAYGEIMMRLTPFDYTPIEDSLSFSACYGGTESNVLVALSHLRNETSFVSKVPDNSLGEGVLRHLLKNRVGVDNLMQGGSTLGLYFMEQNYGSRSSKVIYHRKNAVINSLNEDDFDYDKIFVNASWFHVTGISLAISNNSKKVALRLAKEAKKRNIKVSFDFNYRSTLWSLAEAQVAYKEIIPYVDVCFGNLFDLNNLLNEKTIEVFLKKYNISYLINTSRTIIDSNNHSMYATAYYVKNNKVEEIKTNEEAFEVLDRIGGGDAFVAGIIHILNQDFSNINEALILGLKLGVLKHLIKGDVLSLNQTEINEWLNNQKRDVVR